MYDPGFHVGDIGTCIELIIYDQNGAVKDISTASTKQIKFKRPSGSTFTKDAAFSDDGTDGRIYYTMTDGDLNLAGLWSCRAYLVLGEAWSGHSTPAEFLVHGIS